MVPGAGCLPAAMLYRCLARSITLSEAWSIHRCRPRSSLRCIPRRAVDRRPRPRCCGRDPNPGQRSALPEAVGLDEGAHSGSRHGWRNRADGKAVPTHRHQWKSPRDEPRPTGSIYDAELDLLDIHHTGKTAICNGTLDSRDCHCELTDDQSLMIQRTFSLRLSYINL